MDMDMDINTPLDTEYIKDCSLANIPVLLDGIPLYSPSLRDIFAVGNKMYNLYARNCIIGIEDLKEKPPDEVTSFHILALMLREEHIPIEEYLSSLKFFTKLDFEVQQDDNGMICFSCAEGTVNESNYVDFVKIIKIINFMSNVEGVEKKKSNAELDAKIAKAKAKLNAKIAKEKDPSSDLNLMDLISVLASEHYSLNMLNIWDLNICQFNDTFKRIRLIEGYDLGIRSLLAGAGDVKPEHFIQKIK